MKFDPKNENGKMRDDTKALMSAKKYDYWMKLGGSNAIEERMTREIQYWNISQHCKIFRS